MAYSTANPPRLALSLPGGSVPQLWFYDSADAATVVRVDTYISDAQDLGMKVGDLVFQSDSVGATVSHQYVVAAINADGSADLTDGTAIDVTNTD